MMQRCRGPGQPDAPGPSRAPGWRWPAVAGAAALLVAAVGCTSPATVSPATVSPATVSRSAASSAAADWPTYDRTAERSGVAVSSPALVAVRQSWTASVDGAVYAQPLVVGSEVIVATENDSVYALGASSGAVLWTRHLASPVTAGLPCGNINPSGITGTRWPTRAYECGAVVNPDTVISQIEGGTVMALGGALFESVAFTRGRVPQALADYRVPRFTDVPELEVVLLDRPDLPWPARARPR